MGSFFNGFSAGDLFSGLGGIASAIGGSISAAKNNKTQKYLTRLNMDFTREMAQKQMEYNSEMYERQLQDYSPAEIRKRLEDAGLNAGLVMSGGSGVASSAGNSPSAGIGSASLNYDPENVGSFVGQGMDVFGRMLASISQSKQAAAVADRTKAETKNLEIKNRYEERQIIANLASLAANTKNTKLRNSFQRMQNQVRLQTMQQEISRWNIENNNLKLQGNVLMAQENQMRVQAALAQKQIDWFDKNQLANLSMIASNIDLNRAQKRKLLAEEMLTYSQNARVKLDYNVALRSADSIIKEAEANASYSYWRMVTQKNNSKASNGWQISPWLGAGLEVLGNAGVSFSKKF